MITDDGVTIPVEVAYANPDSQAIMLVNVPPGTTVEHAIELSGICRRYPEIDLQNLAVGIFGRVVKRDRVLQEMDRVEIYRPLQVEPKEVRRKLAQEGKSMGRRRD